MVYNISDSNNYNSLANYTLKCSAHLKLSPKHIIINILIDTCALQANYASQDLIDKLGAQAIKVNQKACGIGGCISCNTLSNFNLTFYNIKNNTYETIDIIAFVLPKLDVDLIIGRPVINKYKILDKTPLEGDYYQVPNGAIVDNTSYLDNSTDYSVNQNHETCYMCESIILKINSIEYKKHLKSPGEEIYYMSKPNKEDILRDNFIEQ